MYVKQLELTNFKSFGGTTQIPLLPGFTVVSGPNGSGKSNLLDALLFALGLAGSKGMRAERLPDLVNHSQSRRGHQVIETKVKVTFALEGEGAEVVSGENQAPRNGAKTGSETADETHPAPGEWQVTRKLRVTKQGTYTSTYYLNDQPCTLNELHGQLQQLRIYPQGYNVVLQGDVTGIISMNARQRREIIDELAGVADFDRKIDQARDKLDTVKEREERFRIVENELIQQRDRLQRDRVQAEKYRSVRQELESKEQWAGVLRWNAQKAKIDQLKKAIAQTQGDRQTCQTEIDLLKTTIAQASQVLEGLNAQVKALGEEEFLKLQSNLAQQQAEGRQLERQQRELQEQQTRVESQIQAQETQRHQEQQQLEQLRHQIHQRSETELTPLDRDCHQARQALDQIRLESQDLTAAAQEWMEQHTHLRQNIEELLKKLEPGRSELSRLWERSHQLETRTQETGQALQDLEQQRHHLDQEMATLTQELQTQEAQVQATAQALAIAQHDLTLQQETKTRLEREQRDKQRQLDKLEARQQAVQETQGTHATRLILAANLPGVAGTVAQLGQVAPDHQLALETAAGGRLGNIVVDDDGVAAAGIEILKRQRGGRATFLPLNKMKPPKPLSPVNFLGCLDYALNLIDYDPRYQGVFAYVFGQTLVFEDLGAARRYLGQYRIVTLEGELLETSGAMTGGSRSQQTMFHFGRGSQPQTCQETQDLGDRLAEIERLLGRLEPDLAAKQTHVQTISQSLNEARQHHRDSQRNLEQLRRQKDQLDNQYQQQQQQQEQQAQDQATTHDRLETLENELPILENQLRDARLALAELEASPSHTQWQTLQAQIQAQEQACQVQENRRRSLQEQIQDQTYQANRLEQRIQEHQGQIQTLHHQHSQCLAQSQTLQTQQEEQARQCQAIQEQLQRLEDHMGAIKTQRDRQDNELRQSQAILQQKEWHLEKLLTRQQEAENQLTALEEDIPPEAPTPPTPIPEAITLEELEKNLESLEKRLRAMEPVNMLAIEEYDQTQSRLDELQTKLNVLDSERTEILLRIENFTTLRHQAFRESFDAINVNFQGIFAELSDGDGYLQLENSEDPFAGGLNLVAHPKGKPVQRLASMSGGEKSLTALSFIFALQRYRPSPFYAFDEVDMFLDGANVERLSKMIQKQAQQAQFIVVSLRRPMIEASQRTIGVTQARGQHTQVIGLALS
ncbi:chromosome segregation protein SMC [Candidatus Synechococcus calcipolaris G9]|uniref:Chromosome partition protein Smc n=1 Tax=Candidatus Synechococcus calcipolaris G9 TaxID=1497997 RepID=A0ABT6EYM1_9SYNE|nr:chromosome segregation protein SMC [Candidatus Synechococcus calcipolaris]MDG2990683.1 chromosome segregation protein SMC [Candidatus Synechococcus calcipolaris G9]